MKNVSKYFQGIITKMFKEFCHRHVCPNEWNLIKLIENYFTINAPKTIYSVPSSTITIIHPVFLNCLFSSLWLCSLNHFLFPFHLLLHCASTTVIRGILLLMVNNHMKERNAERKNETKLNSTKHLENSKISMKTVINFHLKQ